MASKYKQHKRDRFEEDLDDPASWAEHDKDGRAYQYFDKEFEAEPYGKRPVSMPDELQPTTRPYRGGGRVHERDPNKPKWRDSLGVLTWFTIRVSLVGTDSEGRQIISIRKGRSEPIWIRFGRTSIELFKGGKKIEWE